jgi:hypothetical protein
MTDSNRDTLNTLAKVLLRCWILGFVLLFISLGAILLMGETIHNLHGSMFGLSAHELDVIFYCWMGLLKIEVLTFFFIPWLSIKMVLRSAETSQP